VPRIPYQAWQMGVRVAQSLAHSSPLINGYGLGQNIVGGHQRGRALVFYVNSKPDLRMLEKEARIPPAISLQFRGRTIKLPTDVQLLPNPKLELQMKRVDGRSDGTYTWPLDRKRSILAAHVAGNRGSVVTLDGQSLGRVTRSLRSGGLDAVEVTHERPSSLDNPWDGAFKHATPRYPELADLDRKCSVWVRTQQRWETVTLWGTAVGFTSPSLGPLAPQHLILTDWVTNPGDSGTLLLGWDCHPIGMLLGRLRWEKDSYSAFTTLATAMDLLP
jgi:hypothetical protein